MKNFLIAVVVCLITVAAYGQNDANFNTLKFKDGKEIKCQIDSITNDSVYITREFKNQFFSGVFARNLLDEKQFALETKDLLPSTNLLKAGNRFMTSYFLTLGSSAMIIAGIKDGKLGPLSYVGMGTGLLAAIINLSAMNKIRKAGKQMQTIKITNNGIIIHL